MLRDVDTLRPFDACPCGSGLCYGRCHGQPAAAPPPEREHGTMERLAQALRVLAERRPRSER